MDAIVEQAMRKSAQCAALLWLAGAGPARPVVAA